MEKIRMFYGKIRINIRKILLNSNDSELEDESWQQKGKSNKSNKLY